MNGVIKRSNTLASPRVSNEILDNSLMNNTDGSIMEKGLIERFKVILIGDASVGKTSILQRFLHNKFKVEYTCTIGVDYCVKSLFLDNKITVDLQIWDTCGQERFKTLTRQYYQNTNGCLLIFDLSRKETFKNLENWLEDIKNYGGKDMVTLLVGNKSDLVEQRAVNQNEINELISKYSFDYVEISAKTGNFVKTAFETLTKLIMMKNEEISRLNKSKKKDRSQNVTLNKSVITLDQTSRSDKKKREYNSIKCCKI